MASSSWQCRHAGARKTARKRKFRSTTQSWRWNFQRRPSLHQRFHGQNMRCGGRSWPTCDGRRRRIPRSGLGSSRQSWPQANPKRSATLEGHSSVTSCRPGPCRHPLVLCCIAAYSGSRRHRGRSGPGQELTIWILRGAGGVKFWLQKAEPAKFSIPGCG